MIPTDSTAHTQPPATPDQIRQAIAARRSMGLSRLDNERPVDQQTLAQILEAANWAPSHKDTEPWRFVVFTGQGRETLADLFAQAVATTANPENHHLPETQDGARKRAYAAPVWIAIGVEPGLDENQNPLVPEWEEIAAVAAAVQNLHIVAQAHNLAGMWHSKGLSVHPTVQNGLGWSPRSKLLGFFMLGHPAAEWLPGERTPWQDKVTWHG